MKIDYSALSEKDKSQFIISYREVKDGNITDLKSKETPKKLYYTPVKIPNSNKVLKVNELKADTFAQEVVDSIADLGDKRDQVMLYIHGSLLLV